MTCPKCKGTTFISKEVDGESIAYPCDCRKEKEARINLETKLIGARIPRTFWDYTLDQYLEFSDKFLDPKAKLNNITKIDKLKEYIENPNVLIDKKVHVIWIYGIEPNACHTTLAIILGTAFIKVGASLRFITMQDLLNAFTDFNEKNSFFQEFDTHRVYIIDDMFDTSRCIARGDYTKINLYNWLNNALNNNKIIICTSNVGMESVDPMYLQSKIVLSRSFEQFEIQGSLSRALESGMIKK